MANCQFITELAAEGTLVQVPCCEKARWMVMSAAGEFVVTCDVHKPVHPNPYITVCTLGEA